MKKSDAREWPSHLLGGNGLRTDIQLPGLHEEEMMSRVQTERLILALHHCNMCCVYHFDTHLGNTLINTANRRRDHGDFATKQHLDFATTLGFCHETPDTLQLKLIDFSRAVPSTSQQQELKDVVCPQRRLSGEAEQIQAGS